MSGTANREAAQVTILRLTRYGWPLYYLTAIYRFPLSAAPARS